MANEIGKTPEYTALVAQLNAFTGPKSDGKAQITAAEALKVIESVRAGGITPAELAAANRVAAELATAAVANKGIALDYTARAAQIVAVLKGETETGPAEAGAVDYARIGRRALDSLEGEASLMAQGKKSEAEVLRRTDRVVASLSRSSGGWSLGRITDNEANEAALQISDAKNLAPAVFKSLLERGTKDKVNYTERLLDNLDEDEGWLAPFAAAFLRCDDHLRSQITETLSPSSRSMLERGIAGLKKSRADNAMAQAEGKQEKREARDIRAQARAAFEAGDFLEARQLNQKVVALVPESDVGREANNEAENLAHDMFVVYVGLGFLGLYSIAWIVSVFVV